MPLPSPRFAPLALARVPLISVFSDETVLKPVSSALTENELAVNGASTKALRTCTQ